MEFHEEKPDYEEGRLPIEYKVKSQEEIKNSIGGGVGSEGEKKPQDFLNEFWNETKKVAKSGYDYTSSGVKKIGAKMDESGVTDKVKTGAKTVGTKTVEIGGIAYSKTKEGINKIATNEKVKEYSSKAYSGAKEVGSSVWGFFSKAVDQIKNANGNSGEANGAGDGNLGGDANVMDQPDLAPPPPPSQAPMDPVPTSAPSTDS